MDSIHDKERYEQALQEAEEVSMEELEAAADMYDRLLADYSKETE